MDLCCSYEGLSLMLLCILFLYVLMVCEQVFVVSYMIKISSTYLVYNARFFVSSRYFMFVSLKCCKNISAIMPDIQDPIGIPVRVGKFLAGK